MTRALPFLLIGSLRPQEVCERVTSDGLHHVQQALERVSPAALRIYLASHHYRSDWSFTWRRIFITPWVIMPILWPYSKRPDPTMRRH